MADKFSKATRSYTMSRIKKTDTKPELLVRKYLFSKGLRYRIHVRKIPGNPDLVFAKFKTVVFINGCFWHCHEGCKYNKPPKSRLDYWLPKLKKNVERDLSNKKVLTELGWKVLTVWECELENAKREKTLEKLFNTIVN